MDKQDIRLRLHALRSRGQEELRRRKRLYADGLITIGEMVQIEDAHKKDWQLLSAAIRYLEQN